MITVNPSDAERQQIRKEAKEMGVLYNSFSKGAGNEIGMMGEYLVQQLIGGDRVGNNTYAYDIVTPKGITVDVKTIRSNTAPQPHYVARVYGSESAKEKLATKCDVYYFVRCNQQLTFATVIGWLPAKKFMELATFIPRGTIAPEDGRLAYADEFSVPIGELYPTTTKITKKLLAS